MLAAALGGCTALVLGDRKAAATIKGVHDAFAKDLRDQIDREIRQVRAEDRQELLQWLQHFEAVVAQGRKNLLCALEQLEQGEQPTFYAQHAPRSRPADPYAGLAHVLGESHSEVLAAVAALAKRMQRTAAAETGQAEVFVYIAQRLHALVNRTLAALDDVERSVEDPNLLHALFTIDHLVTQTRRAVESLAVLGGETPRRVIKPLLLISVLRQAVAEIEQYSRVRFPLPHEVALAGHAGPDVIHLLAELVENGTKFSSPETQVVMRAEPVTAGLAIEIDDRGLHMSAEKLGQINSLLADPGRVDLRAQLKNRQIGLLVTARLAQRHGIRVELRRNLVGGTQALVVVPGTLLVDPALAKAQQPTELARTVPGASAPGQSVAPPVHSLPVQSVVAVETAGLEPASALRPGPAPLPQRRRRSAAAEATPAPSAATTDEPRSDDRPALPRRSEAQQHIQAHGDSPHTVPAGPASAGLMASYSAGVRRGAEDNAAEGGTTD